MTRLIIDGGQVNATEVNNVVSLPGTVEFVSGTLKDPDNSYSYTTNKTNFIVGEGNSGTLILDARCNYTGKLTGAGKFTVFGIWYRHYLQGDWSAFTGEVIATYTNSSTDLAWDNDYGMPKATLNIAKDVIFNAGSHKVSLANLRGTGTYKGTGTLTIGNDDVAINYPGNFVGTDNGKLKIVKTGKCDWYLSKLVSNITNVTARDGSISLNASKSPYNTKYLEVPLAIEGNSKLCGRGTVGDITVSGNGMVEPGTYTGAHRYGPIFSTGNVTVNPGAALSFYIRVANKGNSHSYIDVKGNLKVDGRVIVELNPDYVPVAGDEFQLWITEKFSGNPTLELPELPEGLEWDATGLCDATGILRVVQGAGINDVIADKESDPYYYTIDGIRVLEPTHTGVYIHQGKKVYIEK